MNLLVNPAVLLVLSKIVALLTGNIVSLLNFVSPGGTSQILVLFCTNQSDISIA